MSIFSTDFLKENPRLRVAALNYVAAVKTAAKHVEEIAGIIGVAETKEERDELINMSMQASTCGVVEIVEEMYQAITLLHTQSHGNCGLTPEQVTKCRKSLRNGVGAVMAFDMTISNVSDLKKKPL